MMDETSVDRWFASYFADFVALGRGDLTDLRRLLEYYAVPFLASTDASSVALTSEDQLLAMMQQQFDAMTAAGFDRTVELASETTILNQTCALHHGRFTRLRADDTEISTFDATYVIAQTPAGLRITTLVIHSPA